MERGEDGIDEGERSGPVVNWGPVVRDRTE